MATWTKAAVERRARELGATLTVERFRGAKGGPFDAAYIDAPSGTCWELDTHGLGVEIANMTTVEVWQAIGERLERAEPPTPCPPSCSCKGS